MPEERAPVQEQVSQNREKIFKSLFGEKSLDVLGAIRDLGHAKASRNEQHASGDPVLRQGWIKVAIAAEELATTIGEINERVGEWEDAEKSKREEKDYIEEK